MDLSPFFALFTKDDWVRKGKTTYLQARPNVMFELGWFYGKLGRDHVTILLQKGTKIPSDLDGIYRIEFEGNVLDQAVKIRKELT